MANTLKIKRGAAASIPQGQLAEPLFTTDTYDLYIGKGSGGNQRIQNYIASGTSSQFLKGDGSLDSTTYQATSEKGQNNGYASLDAGGKIPAAQLPSSVIEYKGTWNASTNTPTLADGTGDTGDVYIVSVGGTQNLGSGSITFDAGDWVMYNGSVWQKSTGSNAVASVNGQTGIVSIGVNDLDDATITSVSNGQLLQYSTGTNKWVNWTPTYISAAITSLNGLTGATQTFATGTTGTDFGISSASTTHTFNLPIASATNTGKLSSTDWSTFNSKEPTVTKGNLTEATSSVLTITGGTGAVIGSGTTIAVASAGAAQNGVVTTGTQTFAGAKTFSSDVTINSLTVGRGAGNDSSNTVLGNSALGGSTTSVAGNTAIGTGSLGSNTSGFGNTALGYGSLDKNTTGQSNTAIGVTAGQLIIGSYNTFVGRQAFSQATSGSNNTIIGYAAGIDITSGSNNTLIGGYTGPASALSGNVIISDGSGNIRFLHNGTNGKLPFLTSNGFVKTSGSDGTLSIDTNTYLTTSSASSTYLPLAGGTLTGTLNGITAIFENYQATDYISLKDKAGFSYTSGYITINGSAAELNFARSATNYFSFVYPTGARAYTLPNATGTIALTSDLSAYLPLTGGTLTGALSGTSATFSGFVGVNGSPATAFPLEAYINSATAYTTSSRGNVLRVYNTNTGANIFAGIELGGAGSANDGLAGINATVTGNGSAALTFYTRDANTFSEKFRIASTGAATFSSSVTSTFTYNGGGTGMLHLTSNGTEGGSITFEKTSGTAQKYKFGNSGTALFVYNETAGNQPFTILNGGNVGIGTSSPSANLVVGTQSSGSSGASYAADNSIIARVGAAYSANRVVGFTIANTAAAAVNNEATLSFIVANNFSATGLISSILTNSNTAATDMTFFTYSGGLTERMRITSGGAITTGGLTDGYLTATNRGNITIYGSTDSILALRSGASGAGYFYHTGTHLEIYNTNSGYIKFATENAEVLRLTKEAWLYIQNRTAAPAANPVTGGYLYCESGALKYRGSSGTVTTIANA